MTRDQFKEILDKNSYKWTEEGEWIIVSGETYVNLDSLESIPDNIQFNNRYSVYLNSLESIPSNVQFNNGGDVYIRSLKSIPDNFQFNNSGYVYLEFPKYIPINIDSEEMFRKCKNIYIEGLWIKNIPFPDSAWKRVDGRVKMYESWIYENF